MLTKMLLGWVARGLGRRLGERRIRAAMDRLPPVPPRAPSAGERDLVRVAAVQAEAKPYRSLRAWIADLDAHCAEAARQGADLVCFPEFFGVLPATLSPAVRFALRRAGGRAAAGGGGGKPPDLAGLLAPFAFLYERHLSLMARFARRYGVYVSCGTALALEGGRVYNRHALLAPNGAEVCHADKMHLTEAEQALGLSAGDALGFAEFPIGRVALAVCMDATYYETFRAAKALGADYLLLPIGDMAAYDGWLALRGAQSRVSETGLCAVKAALTSGAGFPLTFSGRAGVYLPLELGVPSEESESERGARVVAAGLPLGRIRAFSPALFDRKNASLDRAAWAETLARAKAQGR